MKLLKIKKIFSLLLIFISFLYLINITYKDYLTKINEQKEIKAFFKQYINDGHKVENEYLMILEIPKIWLKKGIYPKDDLRNNIDKNIMILNMNNNLEYIVLVSHSGNAANAYFKDLYKLYFDDSVIIYYNKQKIEYKVNRIYRYDKKKKFSLNQNDKKKLILITCLNKENYLIIECV